MVIGGRWRAGLALTTLLATAAGPATVPATKPAASAAAGPAKSAGTTAVRRATLHLAFDVAGTFEPVDAFEVRLAPKRYAGELTIRQAVGPGATVAKGDLLLSIDTDPIDRQIAAAEQAADVARAMVAKAESDVALGDKADALAMDVARQQAADARASLKRWDATDGPAAVTATNLQQKEYDNMLEDSTDELDQLRQMYKSEDLTNKTADIVLRRATQSHDVTEVSDRLAKLRTEQALAVEQPIHRRSIATGVAEQELAVDALAARQAEARVVRTASLAGARAAGASADRALAELKADRALLTVTSPVDGVVVYGAFAHKAWSPLDPKRLAAEEKVTAEQVVMTVYQPGKLTVTLACPEDRLTAVPPGTAVSVRPAALPEESVDGTTGPAAACAATAHEATFDVPVTLATAADRRLAPGYSATVGVDVQPATDVLVVPTTAVWHGKVWVRDADGQDAARPVSLGRHDAELTEVRAGVAVGDLVVTKPKP